MYGSIFITTIFLVSKIVNCGRLENIKAGKEFNDHPVLKKSILENDEKVTIDNDRLKVLPWSHLKKNPQRHSQYAYESNYDHLLNTYLLQHLYPAWGNTPIISSLPPVHMTRIIGITPLENEPAYETDGEESFVPKTRPVERTTRSSYDRLIDILSHQAMIDNMVPMRNSGYSPNYRTPYTYEYYDNPRQQNVPAHFAMYPKTENNRNAQPILFGCSPTIIPGKLESSNINEYGLM